MFNFYLDFSAASLSLALLILVLRILNNSIGTLRLVMVARGQRFMSSLMGFFEALIFAITVTSVVTDFDNLLLLFSYCLGFAMGSYFGLALESRLITSYVSVNIFTHNQDAPLAERLREKGYGVTTMHGEGKDGAVNILRSIVTHRDIRDMTEIVKATDPQAFVMVENTRSVLRGWIQSERGHRR